MAKYHKKLVKLKGELMARCIACKHTWALTVQQGYDAQRDGMASCPKCYSPATVERARVKGA